MSSTPDIADSTPAQTTPPTAIDTDTPPTSDNAPLTTDTPSTTPPHILARNRQNAQDSTGPRSPEGKAISARNALTHGLRARLNPDTLVPQPDREDYNNFLQDLREHLDPTSPLELLLVERIALLAYKLRRHAQAEANFLDHANRMAAQKYHEQLEHHRRYRTKEPPAPPALETPAQLLARFASSSAADTLHTLHRYETATERAFYKALHQYHALRSSTQSTTNADLHHHFHYHRHTDTSPDPLPPSQTATDFQTNPDSPANPHFTPLPTPASPLSQPRPPSCM